MAKTLERAAEADLFLWVVDATLPCPPLPAEVAARLTPTNTLVLLNKHDLLAGTPIISRPPPALPALAVSALTGEGVDALNSAIGRHAEAFRQDQGEDLIAINSRHVDSLRRAREGLEAALAKLTANGPTELLASDLRSALDAFGEIAGKIDNERMLDHLFSTFCIGK
jgi:tRNA modification GTPase